MSEKSVIGCPVLLGFIVFFTACGESRHSKGVSSEPPPSEKSRELNLFSWSEYFNPEVIEQFSAETGIVVNYEIFGNTSEMEAGLKSRPEAFDVVIVEDALVNAIRELGLIRKLDRNKLKNFKNLEKKYIGQDFDPGNEYSVPYLWGNTLIAYRSDKIAPPVSSWNSLWDPKYQGRVMMMDHENSAFAAGLLKSGFSLDSKAMENLEASKDALIQQIELVGVRYGSDQVVREGLKSGDVWIAMAYSGDAAMVAAEEEAVKFFIPDEGAPIFMDNFSISRASQNLDAAYAFIDYLLQAEPAAKNAEYLGYGTPNAEARKVASQSYKDDPTINPRPEVENRCKPLAKATAERELFIRKGMREILQKAREHQTLVSKKKDKTAFVAPVR